MNKPTTTSWTNSLALKKLRGYQAKVKPFRLAFLDIDDTLAGDPADQQKVRAALEEHSYVTACVTNRDLELNLSLTAFQQSTPAISKRDYGDIDRSTLSSFAGLLDADIIASSLGEEIAVKQVSGGFLLDDHYQPIIARNHAAWHAFIAELIQWAGQVTGQQVAHPRPTRHLRVQITFDTLTAKKIFEQTVEHLRATVAGDSAFAKALADLTLTDESDPDTDPPYFSLLIAPASVSKKNAVEHIVSTLAASIKAPRSQFEVLIAGDGPSDLPMGLHGAAGTKATFLIPGGGRLAREPLPAHDRAVVIGDQAFPGTAGPATILAWLTNNP